MNKNWTRGDVARDPADGETVKVIGAYPKEAGFHEVEVLVLGRLSYGYAVGDVVLRELDDPTQPFGRVLNEHEPSALRAAFCQMLAAYPGPDATTYIGWARSGDPGDTVKLRRYVDDTIRAIERVGYDEERAHMPMLRALAGELRGEPVSAISTPPPAAHLVDQEWLRLAAGAL